jgi:hypothetical protein
MKWQPLCLLRFASISAGNYRFSQIASRDRTRKGAAVAEMVSSTGVSKLLLIDENLEVFANGVAAELQTTGVLVDDHPARRSRFSGDQQQLFTG